METYLLSLAPRRSWRPTEDKGYAAMFSLCAASRLSSVHSYHDDVQRALLLSSHSHSPSVFQRRRLETRDGGCELRPRTKVYMIYCTISINSTSHASQGPILVEIRPLVTGHGGRGRMGPPSAYPIWAWRAAARPKLVEISDHVTVTGPCGRTCPPKRTCHGSHPRSN